MKSSKVKNRGIKMATEDVRILIEEKKERLARQQERRERLEQTIQNTRDDIEQLEYTLMQMERAEKEAPRFIPNNKLQAFFTHVLCVYNWLQHRLHRSLNYIWFCLVISSRYHIESHIYAPGKRKLAACTILSYFKQERSL